MGLDVVEVTRILERGIVPIELAHPEMDSRIAVAYRAQVTLEVTEVHGVKADLWDGATWYISSSFR